MPMAVFLVGTGFGTESFTQKRLANMVVITIGVMIAAYGELNFVLVGVLLQLVSIAVEATRLTMVQVRFCWDMSCFLPHYALHCPAGAAAAAGVHSRGGHSPHHGPGEVLWVCNNLRGASALPFMLHI